jgi:hypothetical protein
MSYLQFPCFVHHPDQKSGRHDSNIGIDRLCGQGGFGKGQKIAKGGILDLEVEQGIEIPGGHQSSDGQ